VAHHINSLGQFQSDKHPDLPPNRIRLSLEAPLSMRALLVLAHDYSKKDVGLASDIRETLITLHGKEAVDKVLIKIIETFGECDA